jgi:uncharacterized protein (TIGR03435 family)
MRIAFALSLAVTTIVVSAQAPAFEVVSIKEAPPPGVGPFRFGVGPQPGGRWVAESMNLVAIIRDAYPAFSFDLQIVGGPGWIRTTRFDINALAAGEPPREQMREMVKRMLVDRFGLKVRTESRELDVYLLMRARADGRLGPGITPSTLDCDAIAAAIKSGAASATPAQSPGGPIPERIDCGVVSRVRPGGVQRVISTGQPLSSVISMIQGTAGRPVIDRSNLTGRYDIELEFARAPGQPSPRGGPEVTPAASIFTAVQEQLGLKLDAAKEAMDVLVIEDVHMPTAD